jgi:hypothetical protein
VEPVIELASKFLTRVNRDEKAYAEYGPSFYRDPRAIEIARIIETQLDIKQIRILGGGSFGTAAATAQTGGEVLKLTSDPSEVEAATVLTGVQAERYPKNVVRIAGAWFLRKLKVVALKSFGPGDEDDITGPIRIGLIRMERVHTPIEDENAMRGLASLTRFVKYKFEVWPWQLRHLSRANQRERMFAAGQEMERMLLKVWQNDGQQVARDVANGINQLHAEGIYGTDFHGGNVGYTIPHHSDSPAIYSSTQTTVPYRENPLTEETLEYNDVKFDLISVSHETQYEYYIRLWNDIMLGPFSERNRAIHVAHEKIDELTPKSKPTDHETRIYKLFDIGQSSISATAQRPSQIPPPPVRRRRKSAKRDESEQFVLPIVRERVKVAELG